MEKAQITKGDMFYADLGINVGSEQNGTRPVVIIQNDVGNKYAQTAIIVPLTKIITNKVKQPTHWYKYNLNYMLDTEHCSDNERQEKLAMIKYTFEQVLSIQAEQVNGKSETLETSQKFTNIMPEIELLNDIIPIDKKVKVC